MISYYVYKIRWYISIALILCAFIAVTKFFSWSDRMLGFGSSASDSPSVSVGTATPQPTLNGLVVAPAVGAADIGIQLTQASKLLEEAAEFQASAIKAAVAWQADIESFRDSPANNSSSMERAPIEHQRLFEQMAYVTSGERMSIEELTKVASRIEILQSKAKASANNLKPTALQSSELAEIIELHRVSKKASRDWTLALRQALAIKRKLETQLVDDDRESSLTVGDQIADAAATVTLDNLDEQIEREARDRALELSRAEERQALVAEATKPEVIALLSPFLAHRYLQPLEMAGTTLRFKKTVRKQPISLSALHGINALADSETGLMRLATLGGHWQLSEPKWSVKSQSRYWSDDDREMLRNAQELLRIHGSVLVEQGLLSP
jgi:hypothetical protein